jgi:spermidine/putrescine transport system substrate-binding protein
MVSKGKFVIAALGLLLVATACGGGTPTPTATIQPTIALSATPEATAQATAEAAMEMTEEATSEATTEATEAAMEMTEEATVEATEEAVFEATTEATEEAVVEATSEATEEAVVEATTEATEEAVVEATTEATEEAVVEATTEATEVAQATFTPEEQKAVGNAVTALISAALQAMPAATPEPTAEATEAAIEMTAEATMEATAEATADVAATEAPAVAEATQAVGEITWTCPEDFSGQSLNIYNWAEYIGASTITDFMELCPGVDVTMDYFDTNETLITKLRAGNPGYDIAIPSDYAVKILADEGLLEPIDLANIPNMANVEDRWKNMYFDPGNVYGVPYLWSSFGILYDKTKVTTPPVSWMDYFTYAGPISWMDDYRGMFGAAFWLMGVDASTVDPVEIEKAATFLKENGSNAVMMQGGFLEPLLSGEVDMILTYSAYSYYAAQECGCDNYVYVLPAEGSAIDTQEVVLLKGADNKRLAEAFMDYLHDPYVNAQLTNDTGYNSTNTAAIAFIKPEILNNPALFMDPDDANRLEFYRPITEAEGLYQQYWDEIRISLGL